MSVVLIILVILTEGILQSLTGCFIYHLIYELVAMNWTMRVWLLMNEIFQWAFLRLISRIYSSIICCISHWILKIRRVPYDFRASISIIQEPFRISVERQGVSIMKFFDKSTCGSRELLGSYHLLIVSVELVLNNDVIHRHGSLIHLEMQLKKNLIEHVVEFHLLDRFSHDEIYVGFKIHVFDSGWS